jgi:hypothetical protein
MDIDIKGRSDAFSIESFRLAIEALAFIKATHDLILTDEQKAMIPDLFKKHLNEISKQVCQHLGVPEEVLVSIFQGIID